MFCTQGHWFKVQNTGYFNGAPYYTPGIKILELSWPFCWYWKEITNRPLRLKHNSECCEACTGDNRQ